MDKTVLYVIGFVALPVLLIGWLIEGHFSKSMVLAIEATIAGLGGYVAAMALKKSVSRG